MSAIITHPPMNLWLGEKIRPGDRIGSAGRWKVKHLTDVIPGMCPGERPGGRCFCTQVTTRAEAMPRRVATGHDGEQRIIYSHVTHAVWPRPESKK